MKMHGSFVAGILALALVASSALVAGDLAELDYEQARWHAIHFKPAIDSATDSQCLECHGEILERRVLEQAPAGVRAQSTRAWYQTLDTYEGPQETFHRRHLVTPYAQQVMDMKCTTCHQGNDPREEALIWYEASAGDFTLRKVVDPKTCHKCHAQFNYPKMGIPGPWFEHSELFGNSCLTCHVAILPDRHKNVDYLKAEAIEEAGRRNADACYGCHGGRAWYRIVYPYAAERVARSESTTQGGDTTPTDPVPQSETQPQGK